MRIPKQMELYGNEHLLVAGIIFLAALTQSITGFGFAIVSMSFLPQVDWFANRSAISYFGEHY